jgi:hypothetical protein
LLEDLRQRVLLSCVAVQASEREEAAGLAVFGLAIRNAGVVFHLLVEIVVWGARLFLNLYKFPHQ